MAQTYMECDTEALAQEYCDKMTAEMCGGKGPQPGNVTRRWAVPRETVQGKWVVAKEYRKARHDKAGVKPGRRQKEYGADWFPAPDFESKEAKAIA